MKLITLLTIYLAYIASEVRADGLCGVWDSYKDEKCFNVLTNAGPQPYDTAKALCDKQNGTLVQITSAEEQTFLTDLVYNKHKVVDDVWIGVKRVGKGFKWELDDTDVSYTNWAVGAPSNASGEDCVQMLPKLTNQGNTIF